MSSMLPFVVLTLIAGLFLPVQTGINAQLRTAIEDPVFAALISFAVGTIGLAAYVLVRGGAPSLEAYGRTEWWMWIGGLLGAFFVWMSIVVAPKLGATSMIALIIAGQLVASLIMDHFGLLGYPRHAINWQRMLGVGMLLGGVLLTRLF